MDFATGQSDELLDVERRLKYRGSARISLESLKFSCSDGSTLDRKLASDLKERFESDECFRLEIRNHIPAKIDQTVLDRALQLSSVSADALQSSGLNGYPRLTLPDGYRLVCLDGRHRLQAASEFFRFSNNRWWTVDLYLSDISFELKTYLSEQYIEQKKPSDGEIYLKVQEYGRHPRLAHLKNRWLNMLSALRRCNVEAISRHPKIEAVLHSLLEITGLWYGAGFRLSTWHKIFSMKCDEDIIAYLEHINAVWLSILGGDREKLREIDQATVEALQRKAPGSSESDFAALRGQITSGQIFSSLPEAERDVILQRLTEVDGIVPSFASFFDDVNYHGDVVRCMQRLVPRSTKSSTVTNFLNHFDPGKLRNQKLAIQISEVVFETKSGDEKSQFLVGYLQLYTYAARFYDRIPYQPTRRNIKVRAESSADAATLRRFAQLAARMGFDSPQISDCLRLTDDHGPAAEAGVSDSPALVIGGSGEPLHRRSGKPFTQKFQLDKRFFFLGHLLGQSRERGEGISSFFVLKSRFHAFFWKSLRYVNTHADGPWQVPVDPQARSTFCEANAQNDVDAASSSDARGLRHAGMMGSDVNGAGAVNDAEKEATETAQASKINAVIRDAALVADTDGVHAFDEKSAEARGGSHGKGTHDEPMLDIASTLPQQGSEEMHLRMLEMRDDGERNGRIGGGEGPAECDSGLNTPPQWKLHADAEGASGSATQSEAPKHYLQVPEEAGPEDPVSETEAPLLQNNRGGNDQRSQAETAPPPCLQSIEDENMSEPSSPVAFEHLRNEPYRRTDNAYEAPPAPSVQTVGAALDASRPGSSKHGWDSRGAIGEVLNLEVPGLRQNSLNIDGSVQQLHDAEQHRSAEEKPARGSSLRRSTQDGPETQRPHVDGLVSQPPSEPQTPQLHGPEKGFFDTENAIPSPSSRYSSQGPGTPPNDILQSAYLQPPPIQQIQQQVPLDEDNRTHSALWRYILHAPEGQHALVHGNRHVQAPHEPDGSRLQDSMENNLGPKTSSRPPSPQHGRQVSEAHQGTSGGHMPVPFSAQPSSLKRASPEPEIRLNRQIKFLIWSGNEKHWTLFDEILDGADAEMQVERLVQEQIRQGRFAIINAGGKMCSVGPYDCYRALRESRKASVVLLDARDLTNVGDRLRESLERVQRKRKSIRIWPARQQRRLY